MTLRINNGARLADLTTLGVGGLAAEYLATDTERDFIDAITAADDAGRPLLVIGGGSNLLVADAGFDGLVIRDGRCGWNLDSADACSGASVTVVAGQGWDGFVEAAIAERWVGLEALAGIPGTVGAAPVQNIGAYGAEVADVLSKVRTWDRAERRVRTFAVGELKLGYRTSLLKESMRAAQPVAASPIRRFGASSTFSEPPKASNGPQIVEQGERQPAGGWHPTPRYVVLDATFQMRRGDDSAPVRYAELARRLGVEVGRRAPLAEVREAVLELRASKGMLANTGPRPTDAGGAPSAGAASSASTSAPDVASVTDVIAAGRVAEAIGTWDLDRSSAGSFFTNPILPVADADALLPADAPRYPVRAPIDAGTHGIFRLEVDESVVKTSAAWLIDQAGFHKGFGIDGPGSRAALSTKHTLALTNRGGASAEDVLALARAIRDGVRERFSITLEPEPVLVGVSL